jgi:hypothetical protein
MTMKNKLQRPHDQLIGRLNAAIGFLFFTECQMRSSRKRIQDALAKGGIARNTFVTASRLIIRDLTEWPSHRWAVCYPTEGFESCGQEHVRVIDKMLRRLAAWTVSLAYEAFESFVKESVVLYLRHYLHNPSDQRLASIHKAVVADPSPGSRKALAHECPRNSDLMALVRKLSSNVAEVEERNNRNRDLRLCYEIITEVRHGVTHADFRIKEERMKKWTPRHRRVLSHLFAGRWDDHSYRLSVTTTQARDTATLLAEYGYGLFKALSQEAGLQWGVLPGQKNA